MIISVTLINNKNENPDSPGFYELFNYHFNIENYRLLYNSNFYSKYDWLELLGELIIKYGVHNRKCKN